MFCNRSTDLETRDLDRLGQLSEVEQDNNTNSEQESKTDSHDSVYYTAVCRPKQGFSTAIMLLSAKQGTLDATRTAQLLAALLHPQLVNGPRANTACARTRSAVQPCLRAP